MTDFIDITEPTENASPSWFGFPFTLKEASGFKRIDLINYMDQHKIGTRLVFAGNLTRQPYFQDLDYRISGELSSTDISMSQSLWIGVYPALGKEQLDYVVEKLEAFFDLGY